MYPRSELIDVTDGEIAESGEPLLDRTGGNFSKAAREAKMDRMYLHQLAQKRHTLARRRAGEYQGQVQELRRRRSPARVGAPSAGRRCLHA